MTRERKERELLSTQNKLDRLKKESGIFERNKLKTIGFGILITIFGPMYNSDPDVLGRSRNALEISGTSHLKLSITIGIFYTVAVIIAHFVWKKQEFRRLKSLEEKIEIIKMELEVFNFK
ncbi:MAG: hypothetical protein KUG68_10565 [Flavobacteriaceae bacterium]|nr:hypothetical protein [Flavobacteriaceae bacterium]